MDELKKEKLIERVQFLESEVSKLEEAKDYWSNRFFEYNSKQKERDAQVVEDLLKVHWHGKQEQSWRLRNEEKANEHFHKAHKIFEKYDHKGEFIKSKYTKEVA